MSVANQRHAANSLTRASRPRVPAADDERGLSGRDSWVALAARGLASSEALRPGQVLILQRLAGNAALQPLMIALRAPAPRVQRTGGRSRRPRIPEGVLPSTRLGDLGTAAETEFRRKVYEKQLDMTASDPRKQFLAGLAADELEEVEDGQQLRKGTVAEDARQLLAHAREDLATERAEAKRGAAVRKVASIGIGSAYRSLGTELGAWERAYRTAFGATTEARTALKGGAFGDAAIGLIARRMYQYKAIPGYSRHTKGLAIDFTTGQGGVTFGPNGGQKSGWLKTWLYRWLVQHAAEHGFEPYVAEPWHWQHTPPTETPAVSPGAAPA